jgi:putative membrane protein
MSAVYRLGLVAAVLALAWYVRGGFGDVGGALDTAGWTGVAVLTAYHMIPMSLCGLAWATLQPHSRGWVFIMGRWIRDGVGELAGFLPLSGEVAGVRMLTLFGFRPAAAGATVVVDVTAEAIAQFFFTLLGVILWMVHHPDSEIARWGLVALGVSVPVLLAMVMLQRSKAMRFLETLPARIMPATWVAPEAEAGLHAAIAALYGNRKRVLRSVVLHLAAWLTGAAEAWVALILLGHPLDLTDVLALESIIFAIRSIAFVVPAAIGLQEGGYMMVGALLGLSPEVALAVSLLKRGRELILGLPALLAWHFVEGASKSGKGSRIEAISKKTRCDES